MNHIAATKPYCGTKNFVLDATVSCSGTNCGAITPNQHPWEGVEEESENKLIHAWL